MLEEIIAAELAGEVITKDEVPGYRGHSFISHIDCLYCKAPTVPKIGTIIRFGKTYYKITDNTRVEYDKPRFGDVKAIDIEMIYPQIIVDVDLEEICRKTYIEM